VFIGVEVLTVFMISLSQAKKRPAIDPPLNLHPT
jgi:hypothetical protein